MTDWDDLFNRSVKTQRMTSAATSRSAAGNETWADNIEGIACSIQPLLAIEREAYAKVSPIATHKMYCVAGLDILPRDRMVDETDATLVYEIVAVEDQAGRNDVDRIILSREIED